jgi:hypothetical protein
VVFGVFAFVVPIPLLIAPAIGGEIRYLGSWSPLAATVLILAGLAAGVALYYLVRRGGFRTVAPFVGGEDASSMERVSGTDFYNTIKDVKVLSVVYKKEESRGLDIYTLGRRLLSFFASALQFLHNGILPTYMVWCLIGMAGLFIIMFFKG